MSKDALDRGKNMTNNIFSTILKLLSLVTIYISINVNAYPLSNEVPDPLTAWKPVGFLGQVVSPISGQAPESWSAAKKAGFPAYYIDMGNPVATNSKNPFGSPEKPRKTIPEITYAAGSYIEIHGGPYNGGGQIIFTANGTPDKPVWFRGSAFNDRAIISGETIVKGQYVILENLEYNVPRKTISLRSHNGSNLHHAVIRNSLFRGNGVDVGNSSVIAIYGGNSTNRFHDIIIFNNDISKFGNDFDDVNPSLSLTKENDYHGVLARSNVDRVWIIKNKIYNLGGDSVQIGVASTADENRPSHVYVVDNDFHTNLENGVDIKESDYTIILNNRMWDWKSHKNNSSTGGAIVIHNKAKHTWVINNGVSDASGGIGVTGGSLDTWVIGNVFKNIRHPRWDAGWKGGLYDSGPSIHFRGGSSGGAINNTIINYDKAIEVSTGEYVFINNLLFNRNVDIGKDLYAESTQSNNFASSNLIYSPLFSTNIKNINCLSCVYQNPKFSNLIESVSISDDSPAVAKGISISNYLKKYKDSFGVEISKDIYGNNRIMGGIDIGAAENQNSLAENKLTKPLPPEITNIDEKGIK